MSSPGVAARQILVAAADTVFAAELERQLQRRELEGRILRTADEALAALEEGDERVALVVLDSSLAAPELFRVYQRLRSEDAATSTPIVFSRSALAAAHESAEGPDTYLGPTATPRDVADRVRGMLPGRPSPPGQAADQPPPPPADESGPVAAEPSGGGARTAILGVLLGIVLGIVILTLIWMGGLPVTLP